MRTAMVFLALILSAGCGAKCGGAQASCGSSNDCCEAFVCEQGGCCAGGGQACRTSEDCCGTNLCVGNVCGAAGCSSPSMCGSAEWCIQSGGCLAKCTSDGDCGQYGIGMTCQQFTDIEGAARSVCATAATN